MLRSVVQIAHLLLQKIAHGDDARHTAVFVHSAKWCGNGICLNSTSARNGFE